jgi:hypothetical protein
MSNTQIANELMSSHVVDSLRGCERGPNVWVSPMLYKFDTSQAESNFQADIQSGLLHVRSGGLYDPIDAIAGAMYELHNPSAPNDVKSKMEYTEAMRQRGDAYGTWVYFPDRRELLRYPDQADHFALRTWRNQPLVSVNQQKILYNTSILGMGMSVGSKIMECLVESGIGNNYYLGDSDISDPTNLNRTSATMDNVGQSKVDRVAARISAVDPWISITPFRNGIHPEQIQVLQQRYDQSEGKIDCIVEEVDNIAAKAIARQFAIRNAIPLVMSADVHDKNVTDVERHDAADFQNNVAFLGRLSQSEFNELLSASSNGQVPMLLERQEALMLKHTGYRHLTVGMMRAIIERGKTIGGLPQLGISSGRGGVDATFAVREILLGRKMPTGRYSDSPRKNFRTGPEASPREALNAVLSLKKYMDNRRK